MCKGYSTVYSVCGCVLFLYDTIFHVENFFFVSSCCLFTGQLFGLINYSTVRVDVIDMYVHLAVVCIMVEVFCVGQLF